MNAEKLDGLLVDYSLGAISEDVADLLDALAEKDADIRKRIDQWRGIATLARRAEQSPRPALPAFPRQRLETARYARQARRTLLWVSAAAACVAVGFFGGLWRQVTPQAPPEVNVVASVKSESHVAAVADFWSMARLQAYQKLQSRPGNLNAPARFTWNDIRKIGGRS